MEKAVGGRQEKLWCQFEFRDLFGAFDSILNFIQYFWTIEC